MFNEKEVKKRLREETSRSDSGIQCLWNRIKIIHPKLYLIIEKWLNGEKPDFEFYGMTIYRYMERQEISYIEAVCDASGFLENPEKIFEYIKRGEPLLYEYDIIEF